jgi:photoactive yellow protein
MMTLPEQLPESELPPPMDSLTLDERTDEELDTLPYGVITLDAQGTILQYNLAESRLARLDRAQVLGKSFFRQVAPCTGTPEFEGRFQEFLRPGNTERVTRFDYLFDFKFGAQQVTVELLRSRVPGRVLLLVNRTKFFPTRADVPATFKAPLQQELAPNEPRQGVLRDPVQRRAVYATPLVFASLRATFDRVAPKGWGMFCAEWGFRWGRLATVDFEADCLEQQGRSLRELPIAQAVDTVARALQRQGWGQLSVDFGPARTTGAFVLTLERSALAEAMGRSEGPRCHLLSGYFRALFSHLAQKLLVVREAACSAQGHPRCAFLVVAQPRKAQLEEAIGASGGDVGRILKALEGGPREQP